MDREREREYVLRDPSFYIFLLIYHFLCCEYYGQFAKKKRKGERERQRKRVNKINAYRRNIYRIDRGKQILLAKKNRERRGIDR
jgi:hypothetical protein